MYPMPLPGDNPDLLDACNRSVDAALERANTEPVKPEDRLTSQQLEAGELLSESFISGAFAASASAGLIRHRRAVAEFGPLPEFTPQ